MKEAVHVTCSKSVPINRCYTQTQYVCLTRKGNQVVAVVRNFTIGLEESETTTTATTATGKP